MGILLSKKKQVEEMEADGKEDKVDKNASLFEVKLRKKKRQKGKMVEKRRNKTPKGIMKSAVPLSCFFDVVKLQKVAG